MSHDPVAHDLVAHDLVFRQLRELPREAASPGFAAGVLSRLEPAAPSTGWSRGMLALAAALVLLTVLGAGAFERLRQRQELRGEVRSLRQEHDQLRSELEALRRSAATEPTRILVGGDDRYDYVLSLPAPVPAGQPAPAKNNHIKS
ncbi:MAG: hypothetical protein ACM3OB_02125 [Acidobacteriota bacterium]